VSNSSDPGEDDGEPFEREPFDAERVADDPIEAFADDSENTESPPGTTASRALENAEVNPELRVLFWKLVLLYKVTVIGGSLGVLFLIFDKGPDVGLELFAGSLALLVYSLYVTKQSKERIDAGEFDSDDSAGEPAGETPDPAGVSDAQGGDA
jgi:hypothetical protein